MSNAPPEAAPPAPARNVSLDAVLCAGLGLVTLYCLWSYARLPLTRPRAADYEATATYLRAEYKAGDLVDLNPFWASRLRERIGDLDVAAFRHLSEEDLSRYRRLWLVSMFGAESRVEPAHATLAQEKRFGRVDVRLYTLPEPAPVLYDFRDHLEQARVFIETRQGPFECAAWHAGRAFCDRNDWNYVGREILELGGEPRRVIWAHPVAWGTKIIEFPDVPIGRNLDVAAGLRPGAVRHGGAPVTLIVEIDGQQYLRHEQDPAVGWLPLRIATADRRGSNHRVTFKIATQDDRLRHFAFSAATRD